MPPTITQVLDGLDEAAAQLRLLAQPDDTTSLSVLIYARKLSLSWPGAAGQGDDEVRASALDFLRTWTQRFAPLGQVAKTYGEYEVEVSITLVNGWRLSASAAASRVCTYEPVLNDDGSPVLEAVTDYKSVETMKLVPKRTRICPPSLLAGIEL